jgi:hypothetical protein
VVGRIMAHWAKLDENNIVLDINVVSDDIIDGHAYMTETLGLDGTWVQTSYNTYKNQHALGGTPFRKNYATIGGTYDSERDAFIPPKRWESWILDEETCQWVAPIPNPDDRHQSEWDEENQAWLPRE